jgi:hypothetical protein
MNKRNEFFVERYPMSNDFALHIAVVRDGNRSIVNYMVEQSVEPNLQLGPAMTFNAAEGQALMDELWNAGIRPSEQGSPGQLKATERHLEDMRALTFKLIDRTTKG